MLNDGLLIRRSRSLSAFAIGSVCRSSAAVVLLASMTCSACDGSMSSSSDWAASKRN